MEPIINFVSTHWADILAIYGALVAAATIIVKITPTTKDDEILGKVIKVLDFLSTVSPKKG